MRKYFINACVILFLFGCSEDDQIKTYSLQGKEISLPFTVGSSSNVINDHGYFLMRDFKPLNGKYFKLMDSDFNLIAEFGESGEGPFNFKMQPGKVYQQSFIEKNELIVLEGTKIFKFSNFLKDSISIEEINYPTNNSFPQNYLFINDSLLWINGGSQEHKFFIVNTNTNQTIRKLDFTPYVSKPNPRMLMFEYNASPHYNQERDIVIWAHAFQNTIELYNSVGDLKTEIVYGEKVDISLIDPADKQPTFFNPIALKEGFIVGLVDNEVYSRFLVPEEEIANVNTDNLKSYLLYYDYEGNLITRITIDKFIGSFCIDFDNQRIIAPISTNEDLPLVEFQIPEELQKYFVDVN